MVTGSKDTRRGGFSLISVLVISMVAMTMMGSLAYTFSTTAASSRAQVASASARDMMVNGIEQARVYLRDQMKNIGRPLRWNYSGEVGPEISSIDDINKLLIKPLGANISDGRFATVIPSNGGADDHEKVTIGGRQWSFSVRIYDMQADGAHLAPTLSTAERASLIDALPQSMSFRAVADEDPDPNSLAVDAGIDQSHRSGLYLIRALLSPDETMASPRMIEVAVIQANGE